MDRAAVVDALQAWASWARNDDAGLDFKPCAGSAEGRYIAECGAVFDGVQPRPAVIDDAHALRVERAVTAAGPANARLLTAVYVGQVPASIAARRIGVPGDPRMALDAAVRAVGDRLAGSRFR